MESTGSRVPLGNAQGRSNVVDLNTDDLASRMAAKLNIFSSTDNQNNKIPNSQKPNHNDDDDDDVVVIVPDSNIAATSTTTDNSTESSEDEIVIIEPEDSSNKKINTNSNNKNSNSNDDDDDVVIVPDTSTFQQQQKPQQQPTQQEQQPIVETETIDWKEECAQMDTVFEQQLKEQLNDLPKFVKPKQFKNNLIIYDYQQEGICWLVQKERNPKPNPFARQRKAALMDGSTPHYCRITRTKLQKPYPPSPHKILADDMGLG